MESALTLEAVAEHFEQWRRNKKKGERISGLPSFYWPRHYRTPRISLKARCSSSTSEKRFISGSSLSVGMFGINS
jgi:hypothetical protein